MYYKFIGNSLASVEEEGKKIVIFQQLFFLIPRAPILTSATLIYKSWSRKQTIPI